MPSKPSRTDARGDRPLSSFKYNPLTQLRVAYLSFLQSLFAAAPKGSYHWEEGESSDIYITDEHPISSDIIGPRPAISITRSAVQFYSLGIDDLLSKDLRTGTEVKSVLIPGTMSINCCSANDLESEHLAWIVAEHLWLMRKDLIGSDLFFEIGRQPQVSAPSPAEGIITGDGGKEWYCTTVVSPFQFPRKSAITPLNQHILREISLNVRTRMQAFTSQGGPAVSFSGDPPVNVQENPPPGYVDAPDVHGGSVSFADQTPITYAAHPLDPSRQVIVRQVKPFRPR